MGENGIKSLLIWVGIEMVGTTALLIYATIKTYQVLGMWAVPLGTAYFVAFGNGIAWQLKKGTDGRCL